MYLCPTAVVLSASSRIPDDEFPRMNYDISVLPRYRPRRAMQTHHDIHHAGTIFNCIQGSDKYVVWSHSMANRSTFIGCVRAQD